MDPRDASPPPTTPRLPSPPPSTVIPPTPASSFGDEVEDPPARLSDEAKTLDCGNSVGYPSEDDVWDFFLYEPSKAKKPRPSLDDEEEEAGDDGGEGEDNEDVDEEEEEDHYYFVVVANDRE
ncbi:formin-like protein 14 [Phragmites australis]|uniref:formin-like protein 14 n=1 Tax=Phragmites australis TaxID=29695 RepID=UPI002D7A15D9|nr:formin-like protein 14 [Phragmites australis]